MGRGYETDPDYLQALDEGYYEDQCLYEEDTLDPQFWADRADHNGHSCYDSVLDELWNANWPSLPRNSRVIDTFYASISSEFPDMVDGLPTKSEMKATKAAILTAD